MIGEIPRAGFAVDPENPDAIVASNILPKTETKTPLDIERVIPFVNDTVVQTAVAAWEGIQERYGDQKVLSEEEKGVFSIGLDNQAANIMEAGFNNGTFGVEVLDCEGAKEKRKYGIVVKILQGHYGPQGEGIEVFVDPIEGTKAASSNIMGSVSIVAGSLDRGHPLIPPEDGDAHYTDRIVASPKLRGKISLEMAPSDIVAEAMRAYNLKDPSQLRAVVMNRERNAQLLKGLEEAGATLIKIDAGDLMPALASLKHRPIISVGSGGKTEAMIAAIAAKAVGGVFEGRYVDKDGKLSVQHPEKLTLDKVCPGDPSNYFVSLASITGTPEYALGLLPIIRRANGVIAHQVSVVDITKRSLFRNRTFDLA